MADKKRGKGFLFTPVNFTDLLTVAFISLKLCDKIDWSWWWVLAPLWGGFALEVLISVTVKTITEQALKEKKND